MDDVWSDVVWYRAPSQRGNQLDSATSPSLLKSTALDVSRAVALPSFCSSHLRLKSRLHPTLTSPPRLYRQQRVRILSGRPFRISQFPSLPQSEPSSVRRAAARHARKSGGVGLVNKESCLAWPSSLGRTAATSVPAVAVACNKGKRTLYMSRRQTRTCIRTPAACIIGHRRLAPASPAQPTCRDPDRRLVHFNRRLTMNPWPPPPPPHLRCRFQTKGTRPKKKASHGHVDTLDSLRTAATETETARLLRHSARSTCHLTPGKFKRAYGEAKSLGRGQTDSHRHRL